MEILTNDEIVPTFRDLCLLLYSDDEVHIFDYSVAENENAHCSVKQVEILSIVSPSEMILKLTKGESSMLQRNDAMQHFYNDPGLSLPLRIKTTRVFVNRCYVWHCKERKSWIRVRVMNNPMSSTSSTNTALVWALDFGFSAEVRIEDMMEISPKFCASTALAFKAHMVHIVPAGLNEWSQEAVDHMKSVTRGKLFHAVLLERQKVVMDFNSPYEYSFGVVLAEKSAQNLGTLQANLVLNSFALPCGPCAGRHDLAYMVTKSPYYSKKDMIASLCNNNLSKKSSRSRERIKDAPDGEWADVLAYLKDSVKNSHPSNIRALKRNWRVADNKMIPAIPLDLGARERFQGLSMYEPIPDLMQNRMGCAAISFEGKGPSWFYIQMQEKRTELDLMMSDLQKTAYRMPGLREQELTPGNVAVAQACNKSKFSYWGRVIITSVEQSFNIVTAIFVDFGFELPVKCSSLVKPPEYLKSIPPFCTRAHLDFSTAENRLIPSGVVRWSSQANKVWKELITEWGKSDPIYYAWNIRSASDGGVIELEELNQKLHFNSRTLRWYAGNLEKNPEYFVVDQLRDHPWLRHFYTSVGVNIVYEKLENSCDSLTFIYIWKDLLKRGHIFHFPDPKKNPFHAVKQRR